MAITFTPGQIVARPDYEDLGRQHGGGRPATKRQPTKDEQRAADDAGDDLDQNPIYREYMADGSYVEYRTAPNGTDYLIVDYKPSAKYTQSQTGTGSAPPGGKAYIDEEGPTGRRLGWDPNAYGEGKGGYTRDIGSSPSAQAASAGAEVREPVQVGGKNLVKVTKKTGTTQETYYEDPATGQRVQPPQPAGQVVAGTLNTTSPKMGTIGPDGSVTWAPNPNYQNPKPDQINLPPTQKFVIWQEADGTTRTEKNPNYKPPSKIDKDPTTGRWIEITEDEDGKPVIRPVTSSTTIKPGDLPVLQARYGEVAQGLGQLASELNQRMARGEITPEERREAFTAAYQQAQTQVTEINSILDNSRAIWSGELQQRGQSLAETQSRRSFASDAAGRAISTGYTIANSAGPGHGKEIAGGVAALLGIQQRFAEGMGGFKESPEIGLPPALAQARGVGLPGFGAPPATGTPPPMPPSPAPAAPRFEPGSGISNATDRGGVPREYTPSAATSRPPVAGMGNALGLGAGYGGMPRAVGGAGMFDPGIEVGSMIGQPGSDPAWEEAVRQAAEAEAQGRYAWDRFGRPSGRFGV